MTTQNRWKGKSVAGHALSTLEALGSIPRVVEKTSFRRLESTDLVIASQPSQSWFAIWSSSVCVHFCLLSASGNGTKHVQSVPHMGSPES